MKKNQSPPRWLGLSDQNGRQVTTQEPVEMQHPVQSPLPLLSFRQNQHLRLLLTQVVVVAAAVMVIVVAELLHQSQFTFHLPWIGGNNWP
jgi:hypothetical protein